MVEWVVYPLFQWENMLSNGNRTERSPVRSVIIRVIHKLDPCEKLLLW